MIKSNINREYSSHLSRCRSTNQSLFIADYTNQSNSARGVEFFEGNQPADIEYFTLKNNNGLQITEIPFDNNSFVSHSSRTRSQCECVVFPDVSNCESWILFAELKYCDPKNNRSNLNKAKRQLFKTRYYYKSKNIFTPTNTCYLLASLPGQPEPFRNFALDVPSLLDMKKKHNVVIRFQNSVEIINNKQINV